MSDPSLTTGRQRGIVSVQLFDRFVPEALLAGPRSDALRRARLAAIAGISVLGSQIFGVLYSVAAGLFFPAAAMCCTIVILVVALVILRRRGDVEVSGSLISASLFCLVGAICIADRGVETPLITANAAVILVGTLLAGPRAGIFWAVATAIEVWGLYAAWSFGITFPHLLDRDGEVLNMAMVLTMQVAVVAAIGVLYESFRLRSLEALADQAEGIEHARRAAVEASRRAELANAAKSDFLANMSHELRTPLTSIIGYTELMIEVVEDGEDPEMGDLDSILSSGRHLLGLINDVLDLSKIEAGKMDLHLEEVDLAGLLRETVDVVRPAARANDNSVVLVIPDEVPRMLGDVVKLRQIMLNLLSNAAKFTHNGEISIFVSFHRRSDEPWLDLIVTDTGIGLSPEDLDRLFQPFVQAEATTTKRFGGTGLGLTITRAYCALMGGDISVDSVPGEGSMFTVSLPVLVGPASA